jgi:hypothetical protein
MCRAQNYLLHYVHMDVIINLFIIDARIIQFIIILVFISFKCNFYGYIFAIFIIYFKFKKIEMFNILNITI